MLYYTGISKESEQLLIRICHNLIDAIDAKLLRLRNIRLAAVYYLLRYSRVYSFTQFDPYYACAASYLAASKEMEAPVGLSGLAVALVELRKLPTSEENISAAREGIVQEEAQILESLGFNLTVEFPAAYIDSFCEILVSNKVDSELVKNISCIAHSFSEDAYSTALPLYYHPLVIACACLKLSLIYHRTHVEDKNGVPWYKWINPDVELLSVEKLFVQLKESFLFLQRSSTLITLTTFSSIMC